ncbi:hypothetical protein F7725_011189 [Dissostichus mawsoni]|uniref:UPAR/Ly6 domain-containing protein n=1 Tax=Dissostichus mawsoni TaxID=36200 RepID=A0A7J5ZCC0_DISMA|nr:hypothetical protein F7725_011189 [Dissostichus mawsoni]
MGIPALEFGVLSMLQNVLLALEVWVVIADVGSALHTDRVDPVHEATVLEVVTVAADLQLPPAAVLNRTMKFLVLALTVALLFTAGQTLDCHHCFSKKAGGACDLSVETCKPGKDACAAASFLRPPHGQYQKCMALEDCEMLKMNSYIDINCCIEDMCNTL